MSSQSKARKIVENTPLPELDSLYISNFLTNAAVQSFTSEFKSRVIPFSFVGMFFDALKKSKAVNDNKLLSNFFQSETTVETYCYLYFLTFKQITSAVIEDKKYGEAMVLRKPSPPPMLSLFVREAPQLSEALDIIQQEQLAFVGQSKGYIKKAFLLYLMGNKDFVSEAIAKQPSNQPRIKSVNDLEGREVNIPSTSGKKIYHLYIPTLPLPTKYPKEQSRVHSSYMASRFISPTKAVDLISNYGIVQVRYNASFIELREQSQTKSKKQDKKLNWSDFF